MPDKRATFSLKICIIVNLPTSTHSIISVIRWYFSFGSHLTAIYVFYYMRIVKRLSHIGIDMLTTHTLRCARQSTETVQKLGIIHGFTHKNTFEIFVFEYSHGKCKNTKKICGYLDIYLLISLFSLSVVVYTKFLIIIFRKITLSHFVHLWVS